MNNASNSITLIGRLGSEPEVRVTEEGTTRAKLRVAVRRVVARDGQQDTDWFDVVAWRKTAEFCGNYLKKGSLVAILGELQAREWQTSSGDKRVSVEIIAEDVRNLTPRDDSGSHHAPATFRDAIPAAQVARDKFDAGAESGFDPFEGA